MEEGAGAGSKSTQPGQNAEPTTGQDQGAPSPQKPKITAAYLQQAANIGWRLVGRLIQTAVHWLDAHDGLLTALATVAIATLTFFLAHDSSQQAAISNKQLSVMQGQLDEMRAEQRPWISVTPDLEGPITYDTEGAHFRVLFTMKNTGHLPATDIRMRTKDDLMTFGEKYATSSVLNGLCATRDNQIQQFFLFPDDTFKFWETFNLPAGRVAKGQLQGAIVVPGILPVVNICIDYSAASRADVRGETAISYQLGLIHGVGFSYVPVSRTIQPGEIIIMPNIAEGNFLK
jgi:hypothetical protein